MTIKDFLKAELSNGPKTIKELSARAETEGVSKSDTVYASVSQALSTNKDLFVKVDGTEATYAVVSNGKGAVTPKKPKGGTDVGPDCFGAFRAFCGEIVENFKKQKLETKEENVKRKLVDPMLRRMGYDAETADLNFEHSDGDGSMDITAYVKGKPAFVVETKSQDVELDNKKFEKQLKKYIKSSSFFFGVLSNGFEYSFFYRIETKKDGATDIDIVHFFSFSIENPNKSAWILLNEMSKERFDRKKILDLARRLERRCALQNSLEKIADEELTFKCLSAFDDLIDPPDVVTTVDEIAAYNAVRGMLAGVVDVSRVGYIDRKAYFAVVLDDTALKTVCRLYVKEGGGGKVEFYERDKNGEKVVVGPERHHKYEKMFFCSIADFCRADIRTLVEREAKANL